MSLTSTPEHEPPSRPGWDADDLCIRQAVTRAGISLESHRHGCVIVAPRLSGRTTMLRALSSSHPGAALWVAGSGGDVTGVFGGLLTGGDAGAEPRAVEGLIRAELNRREDIALFVDDADLLDRNAALLVLTLVIHDHVPVYLTAAPTDASVSARRSSIITLWKDGYLPRIDPAEFDRGHAAELVECVVGVPPAPATVETVMRVSGGTPAGVVDLVRAADDAGRWRVVAQTATLAGPAEPGPRHREVLSGMMSDPDPAVSRLLEIMAPCASDAERFTDGWFPLGPLMSVVGIDSLIGAERSGLVEATNRAVRLRDPALGALVTHQLGVVEAQARRQLVGDALARSSATDDRDDETALLACALHLGSATGPTEQLRACAARSALRLGDPTSALMMLGRHDPWGSPTADAVTVWSLIHLGEWDCARMLVRTRPATDGLKAEAVGAVLDMLTGKTDQAVPTGPVPVVLHALDGLTSGDQSAPFAGLLTAVTIGLRGWTETASDILRAVRAYRVDDALMGAYADLADVTLVALQGNLIEAIERSEQVRTRHRVHSRHVQGIVDLGAAFVRYCAGDLSACAQLLRDAVAAELPGRWGPTARDLLSHATARTNGVRDPGISVLGATAGPPILRDVVRGFETVSRAWDSAAAGDHAGAVAGLVDEVDAALARAQVVTAVDLCEMALRIAPTVTDTLVDVVPRVCRRADELDVNAVVSARAQLLVDHLSALRSGNAPMLETVAAEHERQGRALAAADVLAHAAAAHRRGDTPFRAMMCVARARALLGEGRAGDSIALQLIDIGDARLSDRERDVVNLVAQAMTNREIAAKLQMSVRTVEGHVLRVCTKTGARNRRDLMALFGEGVDP